MKLHLAKPDLYFFEQYNEMMTEWQTSGTQIAPWFLNKPFEKIEESKECCSAVIPQISVLPR